MPCFIRRATATCGRSIALPRTCGTRNVVVTDLDGVRDFIEANGHRDLYVGVATRVDAKRRDLEACGHLWALFVDIDYKDSSEDAARAKLAAFPLPPSIVIASGGGLHCYWLLVEPIDLQNGGAGLAKRLLGALKDALGGDPNSAEPARILRVPGTFNRKRDTPCAVTIEHFDAACRYTLDAIAAVLPRLPEDAPTPKTLPAFIPHGQRHDTLFREGCRLRQRGYAEAEIADALWSLLTHRNEGPEVPRGNIDKLAHDICKRYEPAADTFPETDSGNAEFFAEVTGADRVRYDHARRSWFVFNGHHFRPDRDGELTASRSTRSASGRPARSPSRTRAAAPSG